MVIEQCPNDKRPTDISGTFCGRIAVARDGPTCITCPARYSDEELSSPGRIFLQLVWIMSYNGTYSIWRSVGGLSKSPRFVHMSRGGYKMNCRSAIVKSLAITLGIVVIGSLVFLPRPPSTAVAASAPSSESRQDLSADDGTTSRHHKTPFKTATRSDARRNCRDLG